MKRIARARWEGNLKEGKGKINTQSGVIKDMGYSFARRFGDEPGTNPEELIGAAHAGCFAMAFSAELEKAGFRPNAIDVEAQVNLENLAGSWTIHQVHLIVKADVGGAPEEEVRKIADSAKTNCPVSRLLKADITMEFTFGMARAA